MIAGKQTRELPWPAAGRFPAEGAVWPRRRLDKALIDAAAEAGAEVRWETPGEPLLDDAGRVFGILAGDTKVEAGLVVAATGPPGKVARMLGAERVRRRAVRPGDPHLRRVAAATTTGTSRRASRCATSTVSRCRATGGCSPPATEP